MSVLITPHSVTVQTLTQTAGSNSVLGNPAAGSSSGPIACLCVPLKPEESFRLFGVVLTDAWTVYVNLADAASFVPQAEVTFKGQRFYVHGDVELHANGDDADCAVVYLARIQYP